MSGQTERIPIAPVLLQWARTTAGLDSATAAKKIAVSLSTLSAWESGEVAPTITQLRKAAKVYRRPLAVLLLPGPPQDFDALRDFRRTGAGQGAAWSPALTSEFKRAVSQREVFFELAELSPSSVGSGNDREQVRIDRLADNAEVAGSRLRDALRLAELKSTDWVHPNELLNQCVSAVEALGVLVVQTQGVELDEMRAFSISDQPFAVIALNGKDWPRPRLFSLMHELCHIALNAGGLCDLHDDRDHRAADDEVEHFCNQVAASVLMPAARLLSEPLVSAAEGSHQWSLDELQHLGRAYGASSEALMLRLITLGKADWDLYRMRKIELADQYEEARRQEKERRKAASGGPSYYTIKARDLGHSYVASVLDAYRSRAITALDAADYLEVRYEQIPKLQKVIRE